VLFIVRDDCFKKEGIFEIEPKLETFRFLSREREDIKTEKRLVAVLRSKI
jgi:hypothetical protein